MNQQHLALIAFFVLVTALAFAQGAQNNSCYAECGLNPYSGVRWTEQQSKCFQECRDRSPTPSPEPTPPSDCERLCQLKMNALSQEECVKQCQAPAPKPEPDPSWRCYTECGINPYSTIPWTEQQGKCLQDCRARIQPPTPQPTPAPNPNPEPALSPAQLACYQECGLNPYTGVRWTEQQSKCFQECRDRLPPPEPPPTPAPNPSPQLTPQQLACRNLCSLKMNALSYEECMKQCLESPAQPPAPTPLPMPQWDCYQECGINPYSTVAWTEQQSKCFQECRDRSPTPQPQPTPIPSPPAENIFTAVTNMVRAVSTALGTWFGNLFGGR